MRSLNVRIPALLHAARQLPPPTAFAPKTYCVAVPEIRLSTTSPFNSEQVSTERFQRVVFKLVRFQEGKDYWYEWTIDVVEL